MKKHHIAKYLMPTLAVLVALPASAHTPSAIDGGFFAAIAHTLSGVDHMIAMLSMGVFAALYAPKQGATISALFAVGLLLGLGLAQTAFNLPLLESGIAVSLLVIGLLIAGKVKLHVFAASMMATSFALFHGYAHGAESAITSVVLFATGLTLASVSLQVLGFLATQAFKRYQPLLLKAAGLSVATAGAAMFVS